MKIEGMETVHTEDPYTKKQPRLTDNSKKMRLFNASKWDPNPLRDWEERRLQKEREKDGLGEIIPDFGYDNWVKTREQSEVHSPEVRGHHAGCVIGCGLIIHGGSGVFGKTVLNDWHMFDLGLSSWIKLNVVTEAGLPIDLELKNHSITSFLAADTKI